MGCECFVFLYGVRADKLKHLFGFLAGFLINLFKANFPFRLYKIRRYTTN